MKNNISNIIFQPATIRKQQRQLLNGHRSFVLWFTGLSASGKSTLSNALEYRLNGMGIHTYLFDGDNIRLGLCKDLDFSEEGRRENIRRISEVTRLFVDAGIVVLTSFISPYRSDRNMARQLFEQCEFIEIYVKCPLHECERRDPKGLYLKARSGCIKDFTGITAPYEEPIEPDIIIETDKNTVEQSVEKIISYLNVLKVI